MTILGNILWIILGGIFVSIGYLIPGLLFCLTIIGIPFGVQLIKLAGLSLLPFGKEIYDKPQSNSCLSTIFNVLWIVLGGIWVSLSHLIFAAVCAITILGIPFARQHLKLMSLALTPFGKDFK
jgi:uncharacterized membrane protein YccF (DUF307 family)